jgi:putative transcriptional regulator
MEIQLSNYIREWRESSKISQLDLAFQIGITRQTLSGIENRKTIPSVKIALKLSQKFKVPVNELFTLENKTR